MPKIHVCLTPALINLFDLSNKRVVVTDVLRATSAMVTGLAHGVASIRPVTTAEEAKRWEDLGYQGAAERDGKVVEGFSFGNSPFAYMGEEVKGKKIALTTTNGTKAIQLSNGALEILAAGFVNLESTVAYCAKFQEDVLVHCAGWKDQFNIEDTLFAGAMVYHLEKEGFHCADDVGMAAKMLYEQTKNDLFGFLKNSSHYHRLARLGIERDIEYCLQENVVNVVGVIKNGELVSA